MGREEYLAGYPAKISQKLRRVKQYKLLFAKLMIKMQKKGLIEVVVRDDDYGE